VSALIHIGVAGARGRMGRAVQEALSTREDALIAVRFDRGEEPDLSSCDVVIDFTTAEGSAMLADRAALAGKPALVIGSTGFDPAQRAAVEAAAKVVPVVLSGNFSLGVNVMLGLVREAATRLDARDWDIEIFEAHHRRKADAPSGTALMLGEAAAQARGSDLAALQGPPRNGVTGPRETGQIGFTSQRGGGIVGEHQVVFAAEDEILTLSHSARDRSLFARGAVEAAVWVAGKPPGLYDMQDVLGFKR
jgi:4-hydroxy-tetrahydrodipicolinate reductase